MIDSINLPVLPIVQPTTAFDWTTQFFKKSLIRPYKKFQKLYIRYKIELIGLNALSEGI